MNADEKRKPLLSRKNLLKGVAAAAALECFAAPWEADTVHLRRENLYLPRWTADGFRIAFLSDLHANNEMLLNRTLRAIRMAFQERPDVIVIGGDYLNIITDVTYTYVSAIAKELASPPCPVFSIWGNHDWKYRNDLLIRLLDGQIEILANRTIELQGVSFVGLDDGMYGSPEPRMLKDARLSKNLICLWHEPDTVDFIPDHVSLQLSGHSHGGEICLPGSIPIHTPNMAQNYKSGFYVSSTAPLYVTKGLGNIGPIRLNCPPEFSILTLHGSNGGPARCERVD